ncbi:extracellular serine carboxypeptidase 1 [Colletotrichum plurivorum]|uniref:Extracellular serine carboxypeptidase 1 n=1 Tax=Colletotrichum plurivorum TaxID=2175906 RepID=A0A8H6N7N0_9PEZI|nr:extracellular serine carboxypeptidase 1 [Colletotrichum plurivorum]
MKASILASVLALAATAAATLHPRNVDLRRSLSKRNIGGLKPRASSKPDSIVNATFNQLLDHTDPSKGTFKQRYWYNAEHWGGPGYPIFMINGGEGDASVYDGYLENGTIMYLYAEKFKGAIVLFEREYLVHGFGGICEATPFLTVSTTDRYYGESLPFKTLTAETLQYHNVPQSIYDNVYFAETAKLGFDKKGGANADKSPWVLIGGSYPGALAAWTSVIAPGTFAAYHASSAVVQAIEDFWQFFTPIEQALPRNCSADIKLVVKKVDSILSKGDKKQVAAMKKEFGLESMTDNGDFAYILYQPVIEWASNETAVFEFCDYIETSASGGKVNKNREKSGVGLDAAWKAYTAWMHASYNETCAGNKCSWNANRDAMSPTYLKWERSWRWQLCNEPFGWWHVGPPKSDGTNIVSSHIRPQHEERDCDLFFPGTKGFKPAMSEGFTADMFNAWTKGGWNATYENVMFVDGEFDPWKSATMSSDYRPGGPSKSTEKAPRLVVKGAGHVPDYYLYPEKAYASVTKKQVEIMGKWLKNWKPKKGH